MTIQEKMCAEMHKKAAGKPLGPLAQAATQRPANYAELSPESQWAIDKSLDILDWSGAWNE